MMRRIVITGAKGYIGTKLCSELRARGCEVAEIDLGDRIEDLSGAWDAMVSLAWIGKGGALRADYNVQINNVKMSMDFYQQAIRLGCRRFVCAGTIGQKMLALPECAGIKSQNFVYINAKTFLQSLLRSLGSEQCKVVWATLGNLYGGASGGNIIEYTLKTILSGSRAIFGPAEQPYDFIAVDDCVRALSLLSTVDPLDGDEFYVGNGRPEALSSFLRKCGELCGRPDLIGIGERPDDGTRYRREWFDVSLLRNKTGFSPSCSFEDGVRENIKHLKSMMKEAK